MLKMKETTETAMGCSTKMNYYWKRTNSSSTKTNYCWSWSSTAGSGTEVVANTMEMMEMAEACATATDSGSDEDEEVAAEVEVEEEAVQAAAADAMEVMASVMEDVTVDATAMVTVMGCWTKMNYYWKRTNSMNLTNCCSAAARVDVVAAVVARMADAMVTVMGCWTNPNCYWKRTNSNCYCSMSYWTNSTAVVVEGAADATVTVMVEARMVAAMRVTAVMDSEMSEMAVGAKVLSAVSETQAAAAGVVSGIGMVAAMAGAK
jgi:hypothetical protein